VGETSPAGGGGTCSTETHQRIGFGLRDFENYRIRALLYAGSPNWRSLLDRRPMR
jgi:hypothetical protein